MDWVGQVRSFASSAEIGPLFSNILTSHRWALGKGTLARLNATPTEYKTREETMAGAIRTILECIGEDPDRPGLLKTPERYAKALLWMTKGYEEKLQGNLSTLQALEPSDVCFRGHR